MNIVSGIVLIAALIIGLSAAAQDKKGIEYPHMTVADMVKAGPEMNDRMIVVDGCYTAWFEVKDLFSCDRPHDRSFRVWVNEPPGEEGDRHLKETGIAYRHVVLLGRYATGSYYGHENGYRHQFTVYRVYSMSDTKKFLNREK
jgi:hypothetical protein